MAGLNGALVRYDFDRLIGVFGGMEEKIASDKAGVKRKISEYLKKQKGRRGH